MALLGLNVSLRDAIRWPNMVIKTRNGKMVRKWHASFRFEENHLLRKKKRKLPNYLLPD